MEENKIIQESLGEKALNYLEGKEGYTFKDFLEFAKPIVKASVIPLCSMDKAYEKIGISEREGIFSKSLEREVEIYKAMVYIPIALKLLDSYIF